MTNVSIGGLLSLEEEDGSFKFVARGGWPVTYFSLKHIDEMIVLLQGLQQEREEQEERSPVETAP